MVIWACCYVFSFFISIVISHFSLPQNKKSYFENFISESSVYLLQISTPPLEKEKLPFYYLRGHLSNLSLRKIERVEFGEFFQSNAIWTDNFHVQYKNLRGLIVKEDFEIKQSSQSIPLHFCLLSKEVDLKKSCLTHMSLKL